MQILLTMCLLGLAAIGGTTSPTGDEGPTASCGTMFWYYPDDDLDGYGDPNGLAVEACPGEEPNGYVVDDTDCDDKNPDISPVAYEWCDGIDNDCDTVIDSTTSKIVYEDDDEDNYGKNEKKWSVVSMGAGTNCAIPLGSSGVTCWGEDTFGLVTDAALLSATYSRVAVGDEHSCALSSTGDLTCWGDNTNGQLNFPTSGVFTELTSGSHHSCAIETGTLASLDGKLNCWGDNVNGQLYPLHSGFNVFSVLSAYQGTTCALGSAASGGSPGGEIVCWGDDEPSLNPIPSGLFSSIVVGDGFAIALDSLGSPTCFGSDLDNVCGNIPVGVNFTGVAAGNEVACGVEAGGNLYCWGSGGAIVMLPPLGVEQVHFSTAGVCVIDTVDGLFCWGGPLVGMGADVPYVRGWACGSPPDDYVAVDGDCDDDDPSIFPGADETCASVDQNCDGDPYLDSIDDEQYYPDLDCDGYGEQGAAGVDSCVPPNLTSSLGCDALVDGDCVDTDPTLNPATVWYEDYDNDGYGSNISTMTQCAQPGGYVRDDMDCDDNDPSRSPDTLWYADFDGDGFGDASDSQQVCLQPAQYVLDNTDCNDGDSNVMNEKLQYRDADGDGFGDGGESQLSCSSLAGFVQDDSDCDDQNAAVNPDTAWYEDADLDGYGLLASEQVACLQPNGFVLNADDCDDADSSLNPTTNWFLDSDADGEGDATMVIVQCTQPQNYVLNSTDCDDQDDTVYLAAIEICDEGIDNDCNGVADDLDGGVDLLGAPVYFIDGDGDGFGSLGTSVTQCAAPPGYVLDDTDCNDSDPFINSDTSWYEDSDGDGYGLLASGQTACLQPANFVLNADDCDDADSSLNPTTNWFADSDVDGEGDVTVVIVQCIQPQNYVLNSTDCDDEDDTVYLAAIEICDEGIDNDCNGYADDLDGGVDPQTATTYFKDSDQDGYGTVLNTSVSCELPQGYVVNGDDCDDTNNLISPVTEWYQDGDGDGFGSDNAAPVIQCETPVGMLYVLNNSDCADTDASLNPDTPWYEDNDGDSYGAESSEPVRSCVSPGLEYSRVDSDCDDADPALSPETIWYRDDDGDQFGVSGLKVVSCEVPGDGFALQDGDCDDGDSALHPNTAWYPDSDGDGYGDRDSLPFIGCVAPDSLVFDGADSVLDNLDCDDTNPLISPESVWYRDGDGDGYGFGYTEEEGVQTCEAPEGIHVLVSGDCDDTNDLVNPAAIELVGNQLDEDCVDGAARADISSAWFCSSTSANPASGFVIVLLGFIIGRRRRLSTTAC